MIIARIFILSIILLLSTLCLSQTAHWRTAMLASDECSYFSGKVEPTTNWTSLEFDDSSWERGKGGVGYSDADDMTIIDKTISVYLRYKFEVTDVSKIEEAILHGDYDDGFVAYLNGQEIARDGLNGTPPAYNEEATALHEALLYQTEQPESFTLAKSDLLDMLTIGTNILAFQVHNFDGLASSDLSSNFYFSFGFADNTSDYTMTPTWFIAPITSIESSLPIIKINTNGRTIVDEPKILGTIGIINSNGINDSEDPFNEYEGVIGIEKRGQSSLSLFPKVGYAFEMRDEDGNDIDTSFLNFPEEEDFILHGPYSDKSLMRNVLAMNLANKIGGYNSRTQYVELFINDRYEGIYVVMERIKRDKNRVDIARLKEDDIEGDELTGGYVFKIDKGTPDWRSNFDIVNRQGAKIGFQYVSPNRDDIVPEQADYIASYVDSFELALSRGSFGGKTFDEYIDIRSFVDHFIVKELAKDVDAYRISSYYYKEKDSDGGNLFAGPVWDFNIAFGNANYCEGGDPRGWMYSFNCDLGNPFWWDSFMRSSLFTDELSCRWTELREGPLHLDSIMQFIDTQEEILNPNVQKNFDRWPVLNKYIWPNAQVLPTFSAEINYLKQFIIQRLVWMDNAIDANCVATNTTDLSNSFKINIYPNPIENILHVELEESPSKLRLFHIVNSLGTIMETILPAQSGQGMGDLSIDVSYLNSGVYYLQLVSDDSIESFPFVKL